jgi:hypothetical protein
MLRPKGSEDRTISNVRWLGDWTRLRVSAIIHNATAEIGDAAKLSLLGEFCDSGTLIWQ